MPSLLELYTSLKSVSYGGDRAGGGSSAEPYIKKPSYSSDVFGVTDALTHSAVDVLRISKFLTDVPRGPLFVAKQVGLQMTNPQLEHKSDFTTSNITNRPTTGQGVFNNVSNTVRNTGNSIANAANRFENTVGSNRIYTPINLLAQVAGSAFGKHIPRQGFDLQVSPTDKYPYIVAQNDKSGNNRLVSLFNKFSKGKDPVDGVKVMFTYTGGSDSFLGIGKTTINSYVSTFAASDVSNPDSVISLNGFRPIPFTAEIDSDGKAHSTVGADFNFRTGDFRAYKKATDAVYEKSLEAIPGSRGPIRLTDYTKYNTHKRIGVINTNQKAFGYNPNDQINMMSIYYAEHAAGNNVGGVVKDINGKEVSAAAIRDMIKFRIKAIDNDNPGKGMYMVFRAFLNGITDTMDPTWNPVKYIGRGESFYAYEGFTSGYSLSFTIQAFSREEMKPLYQKLNYLKSTIAPDYRNNKMRGNIMELTVGDYIKEMPGFISSLSITVPDDANWEIALNEPDAGNVDKDMHELPQTLKVEMSFTPIYNFLPRKSSHAPFIGIDDTESTPKTTASPKEWLNPLVNTDFKDR